MSPKLQEVIQDLYDYYDDYEVPSFYEDKIVSIDRNSIVYLFDKDDYELDFELV